MSTNLYGRYRFFREHAGYVVGHSAECALRLARAEERAERMGLRIMWDEETLPWDSDCPPPRVHAMAIVRHPARGGVLASLGGIGLNDWNDPYMRVVEAELFAEALAELDKEADFEASMLASEMSERATYAMV